LRGKLINFSEHDNSRVRAIASLPGSFGERGFPRLENAASALRKRKRKRKRKRRKKKEERKENKNCKLGSSCSERLASFFILHSSFGKWTTASARR